MKKFATIFAATLMAVTMSAGELTVADGTATHEQLPVWPYYGDVTTRSQFIYPASYLESMQGSTITSITFYTAQQASKTLTTTYTVSLAVVAETTISGAYLSAEGTKVYEGVLDASRATVTLEFPEPFAYENGNLLVDIKTKSTGNYDEASFYGVATASTTARAHTTYGGKDEAFLPKATFLYDAAGDSDCGNATRLRVTPTPDGGVFTWDAGEDAVCQWCVVAKQAEAAGWASLAAGVTTYTVSGLTADTEYDFCVRVDCGEKQSDETRLTFKPVCYAPANLTIKDIKAKSATIAWDEVAFVSQYQYLCVRKDSAPDWTDVAAREGLSVTLDTLQGNTAYDFYVRSYFSAGVQSTEAKLTFTTDCDAKSVPYSESFDAESLPACWRIANRSTSYGWAMYPYSDETGSNCVSFSSRGNAGYIDTLQMPVVNLTEDAIMNVVIKNAKGISLRVFISTDGGQTREQVADLSQTQASAATKVVDLSAYRDEVNIYFYATATGAQGYIYLDDIRIVAKPCNMPKQLKASATTTGAVITWTAGGDESQWNLRYRAVGADEWKEVTALTTPSDTLGGLVAGTEYEVQVQAACSADKQSDWTASAVFTPQCPQPTSVAAKAIAYDRAVVTWNGTESLFNLEYRIKDAAEWTVVDSIEAKSYRLTDLKAATTYQVRIQTACEGEYSKTVSFTTLCAPLAPETVPYEETFDSIADGQLPPCWERISENEYPQVVAGTAAWGEEGSCLWFNGEGEQIVVLPVFDVNLHELLLMFYYKTLSASLQVGYMTELSAEAFVPLVSLDAVSAYGVAPYVLSLSNVEGMVYLAIRYYDATSAYARAQIDNIILSDTAPTAIGVVKGEKATGRKLIENGSLILEYNGMRFDATGRKL